MRDTFADNSKLFTVKFFVNERHAINAESQIPETSLRLMLNKVSDRPVDIDLDKFKYNRSSDLKMYVSLKIEEQVFPITTEHHQHLLKELIPKLLSEKYELVTVPRQFYANFTTPKVSITPTPKLPPSLSTQWDIAGDAKEKVEVMLSALELADKVEYIGVPKSHAKYDQLIYKKLINPLTGLECSIVELPDWLTSKDDKLIGIYPNHILDHYKFCKEAGLQFVESFETDFHQQNFVTLKGMNEQVFKVKLDDRMVLPVLLKSTVIKSKESDEIIDITQWVVESYNSIYEELKPSIVELLLSIQQGLFEQTSPDPDQNLIITDEFWLSLRFLTSIGQNHRYRVVEVPKIVDYKERDVSKLRLDLNKIYNAVPVDQALEDLTNEKNLFENAAFHVLDSKAVSVDVFKGMLLTTDSGVAYFDDHHKNAQFLTISILYELYNLYYLKFLKQKQTVLSVGFLEIFSDQLDQNIKDWNYYMISSLILNLQRYQGFKKAGDLNKMYKTFADSLEMVNNSYWDLLNSEIMLSAKKPQDLPASKTYLKHLMGTVVYYLHIMGLDFYSHEALYVFKKMPTLNREYSFGRELDKFKENQEIYQKNIDNLGVLNQILQNYLKIYDSNVLNDGFMIMEIVNKLKEVCMLKVDSTDRYSVFLEVPDHYKFMKVKEYESNIKVIYSIFRRKSNFKNSSIKIVTEMSRKFLSKNQPNPVSNGVETYGISKCPGISIHLVKVAGRKQDEVDVNEIEEMIQEESEQNEDDLKFKDVMISEELNELLHKDNSDFDELFNKILNDTVALHEKQRD